MADEERTVVISDARYENPETGAVTTSTKYHLLGINCVRDTSPHRLEVPESTALAFGRVLCGNCANITKRQQAQQVLEDILAQMFDTEGSIWDTLRNALPPNIEMRLLWHDPDKAQPSKIWSSIDPQQEA